MQQVVFGQMLDNREGSAFTDRPFFNQEFIRDNGIHKLNGIFTYKKPGEVMRQTDYKYVYEFDTLGRLTASFETRKDDGTMDTTWNKYVYSEKGELIEHKKGDGKGFTATTFEFDTNSRVIRKSNVREYLDSLGQMQRTVLNSESMTYQLYENQFKKIVFNSYGLPYMEEIFRYNELGYLIEREERLIMTSMITTYKYDYTNNGYISSIAGYRYGDEIPVEETKFTYDDHGNLLDKHIYRAGQYITEFEMLYNEKSKLLTYVLTRDAATNFIMILGFKDYEFFK
ncbi:MAG: hypothetical protein LW688_13185 [Cryomorphaceae bacterium]|jgi:hypothetical protein|nr:hypothetical protein [Cryomorphaceae bacterium]